MIKKILFQPWSNDRLSVFYASFSAYILWAAIQHNWALSTNIWHTQAVRSLDATNTSGSPNCQIPALKSTAYLSFLEAGLENSFAK